MKAGRSRGSDLADEHTRLRQQSPATHSDGKAHDGEPKAAPDSETKKAASISVLGVDVALKWVSLVVLVVQNTLLVLAMRFSRTQGGALYLTSTAVVMAELVKLLISLVGVYREEGASRWLGVVMAELRHHDTAMLGVPGLLYVLQNNLLFVALSNLQAAVYQVTYQLKILTTALMMMLLLGRSLNRNQSVSLVLLTFGVACVQLAQTSSGPSKSEGQNALLGLACVLVACLTSGFAGVFTEKMIKQGRPVSLFMRNIQLSLFGVVLGLGGVVLSDWSKVRTGGFFQGYSALVWFVVLVQAGGGLMIAVVMKYADNILKGFATSISIVLSTWISTLLFEFALDPLFVVGAAVVIGAVFLYGMPVPSTTSVLESNGSKV